MARVKTILDYYEQIQKEYSTVKLSDIKRILQYGYKSLYLHNSYGGDTLINRSKFWFYCGSLMKDSLKWFDYYKRKMTVKLRVMYKRRKILWNGYYYFALSLKQYNEYLSLKNKKGRPRKNFSFKNVFFFKIYDECSISESSKVAIFRMPHPVDMGFAWYKEKMTTDKAELVLVREPLKFSDILLSVYDYEFITDELRKYKRKTTDG